MKTIKSFSILVFSFIAFSACSDDDSGPAPINEEEIITTLTVTLVPNGGGSTITLQTRDLDGDGPNAPEVTVSGDLLANTVYEGSLVLLNETETPSENITDEVATEAEEHQFFYTIGGGLNAVTEYVDFDGNGNPLGIQFTLTTGDASAGTFGVTLRHELTKPNTGLADAGGETDIAVTFNVSVQ